MPIKFIDSFSPSLSLSLTGDICTQKTVNKFQNMISVLIFTSIIESVQLNIKFNLNVFLHP